MRDMEYVCVCACVCVCVCVQRMCAARVRTCLRETMSGYVCVHVCVIETQCGCGCGEKRGGF